MDDIRTVRFTVEFRIDHFDKEQQEVIERAIGSYDIDAVRKAWEVFDELQEQDTPIWDSEISVVRQ